MDKKSTAIAIEQIRDEHGFYPVIQSMSAISGISAINIAAELLSNQNGGKGVLLGGISGITPTEVVIIGADTIAEFAARAALGMGAVVKVFDNSPQRLEELQRHLGNGYILPFSIPRFCAAPLNLLMWLLVQSICGIPDPVIL